MNFAKETPEQKIKRLEQALEDGHTRNLIMSEMIDVVERQHGASLRNKYLARLPPAAKRRSAEPGE